MQFTKNCATNLFTFEPDGSSDPGGYYHNYYPEMNARSGIPILDAVKKIVSSHEIDIICAHDTAGHPLFLFNELSIPFAIYSEFPSIRQNGYVLDYPPQECQRLTEAYRESFTYYAVTCSDVVITPSAYAKSLFPSIFHHKIIPQVDGFDPLLIEYHDPDKVPFKKQKGLIYIGFFGRNLTSEKGLELFVRISVKLCKINEKIRFVLLGQKHHAYGYEAVYLNDHYGDDTKNFVDYLFEKYQVDPSKYIYIDTAAMSYEGISSCLYAIDFLILPVLYGMLTWNVVECLLRGKIVLGSDQCFMPEVITNGEDGFILPIDDLDAWVSKADDIARNMRQYEQVGINAKNRAKQYHADNVAAAYLAIFSETLRKAKPRREPLIFARKT